MVKLGRSKKSISKEFLIREYINNEKSCGDIAKELNVDDETIRNRLIEYNINRRHNHTDRTKNKVRYLALKPKRIKISLKNLGDHMEKGKYAGKKNPFYGKKHTKETIEFMKKISGRPFIERFGEEKAKEICNKISIATSGKNNPMYGKNYQSYGLVKRAKESKGKTMEEIFGKEKAKEKKEKRARTFRDNPEITKNFITKLKKTLKENPEITKNVLKKRKKTLKENPEIAIMSKIKLRKTWDENPHILINAGIKRSNTIMSSPEIRKILKEKRSKQIIPVKDTSIEVKIQNFLKQLGIEFFTHQYMKEIEHSYQCDVLIPSMNLVIECDGNYWHKYPIGNDIDHIRTKELIKKGFKVLRLWEFEINKMSIEEFEKRLNAN